MRFVAGAVRSSLAVVVPVGLGREMNTMTPDGWAQREALSDQ
jgi:hypothetical protein